MLGEFAHLTVPAYIVEGTFYAHHTPFDFNRWRSMENVNHVKPRGGMWLSFPTSENSTVWTDWLKEEGAELLYGGESVKLQEVKLNGESRVLRIDSMDDFLEVLSAYPYIPAISNFTGSEQEFIDFISVKYLDFEKLSRDFDVIWLTENGQIDTHYGVDNTIWGTPNLHGWDIESVFVMNKEILDYVGPQVERIENLVVVAS